MLHEGTSPASSPKIATDSPLASARQTVSAIGDELSRMFFRPRTAAEMPAALEIGTGGTGPKTIFVNGIVPDAASVLGYVPALRENLRQEVTLIYNREAPARKGGFVRAVANAAAGMFDWRTGVVAEPETVRNLIHVIRSTVAEGRPVHLVAHSQGAVIVSNALAELRRTERKWWTAHSSGIFVEVFGAAECEWPAGVKVREFVSSQDPVPKLTGAALGVLQKIRSRVNGKPVRANPDVERIVLTTDKARGLEAHALTHYLESLPAFYEQLASDLNLYDSKFLARVFVGLLEQHRYEQGFYRKFIQCRAELGDGAFFSEVVRRGRRITDAEARDLIDECRAVRDQLNDARRLRRRTWRSFKPGQATEPPV